MDKEYPCTKCIHCKPCEEAYDMDLGDNYQYCPHYDDGKAHEKEIQEYRKMLYKIYNDLYPSQLQVECIRVAIERFLERMDNKHDGT